MITYKNTLSQILSASWRTKFFLPLSLFTISLFTSCDESSVVGLDVQPSNDLLNVQFQDTTTLVTKSLPLDSIRSDEDFQIGSMGLLGKYIDPVFGKTVASIYTQLGLSAGVANGAFGSNPICDSVILSLVYDSASANTYGKKRREQQRINVYKLNESIVRGTNYYSNSSLNYDVSLDLANGYVFTPQPNKMVTIWASDTVVSKPVLRVPLNANLFGQLLLNNQSTGDLASTAVFQANLLSGLYITTENTNGLSKSEGNIMRFRLDESKMIVYYHNDLLQKQHYEFILNGQARFGHFEHDYSMNNIDRNLWKQLNSDPTADPTISFVQAMGGIKTEIYTPYLLNWLDSGAISINKAELIIKAVNAAPAYASGAKSSFPNSSPFETSMYQLDTFSAPVTFALGGINSNGTSYELPDFTGGTSSTYFGGDYNATTHEYHFNIARYIQQVLDGRRENNGLILIVPPLVANSFATRVVIGGGAVGPYQMKLNITYTKLH